MSFYLQFIFPPSDSMVILALNCWDKIMVDYFFFIGFYWFYRSSQGLKPSSFSFAVEPDLEKYLYYSDWSFLEDNLIA